MATVYLARDLRHNRKVALKLLNPDLGAVLGVERFLSEIQVTANLQHPNLLPLFDSGEADGLLFYVMPYVEGESLRSVLEREKQLPVEDALHIASAIASALDYAHRHGVIHRDLKPENIRSAHCHSATSGRTTSRADKRRASRPKERTTIVRSGRRTERQSSSGQTARRDSTRSGSNHLMAAPLRCSRKMPARR
jgi:hypothetical protein